MLLYWFMWQLVHITWHLMATIRYIFTHNNKLPNNKLPNCGTRSKPRLIEYKSTLVDTIRYIHASSICRPRAQWYMYMFRHQFPCAQQMFKALYVHHVLHCMHYDNYSLGRESRSSKHTFRCMMSIFITRFT